MRIRPHRLEAYLRVAFTFIICLVSVVICATDSKCQTTDKDKTKAQTKPKLEDNIRTIIEIGAQFRDTSGSHDAKFQETRDVPAGFFIQKLRLDLNSADSPFVLAARGYEVREDDQRFTVDFGKVGKFKTEFLWDQIPHSFGKGQSFLQKTGPGLYQVSPTLRASLQAVTQSDATRTPVNAPLPNLVRQALLTAPVTDVRLRRDQALFRQSYWVTDNIELHFQFSWLRNQGSRPMATGTFVRRPVPGNGLADIGGSWEGLGQEFLEDINQRTYDLNVGAKFRGKRWNAGVDYKLSLFRNHVPSLTFENPFRVTDDQGCTANPTPPPPLTCGASNRFREVRWQNQLPPSNDSHTLTLWVNVDLTAHTIARGLFSIAYWTQNEPFLPWTLNTAIIPTLWDATSPITKPTDVTQLPAQSLNGQMRNINQEYALVNRSGKFRFMAQYRSQSLDSQSPTVKFPGYAAFGDSSWRAPVTDFYNLPIENLDWDFRRQNIDGGFQWDVRPALTWKVDYDWEIWNRKFRDVNRNNQHSIRNRLDFEFNLSGKKSNVAKDASPGAAKTSAAPMAVRPEGVTTLRFKLDYQYSDRRVVSYNTQDLTFTANFAGSPAGGPTAAWEVTRTTVMKVGVPMEFNLLRRFDEDNRIRNDGTAEVQLLKGERTNFSASYRYLGDEYDKSFYGLLYNRSHFIDAQLTHTFENGSYLYSNYSRIMDRFRYRDLAHLLPNPPAPPGTIIQGTLAQYPIANTWERTSRNTLDSFEIGFNAAPQDGKLKKWEFDVCYALSFARDRITTVNPFTVRADSIVHAGASPYPDTVIRRHDVNFTVTRRINEKFDVGVRYWYEPYTQDDFSFNTEQPYMHGLLTNDTPKYLFQDARYGSYHGSVGSVFVRYTF